MAEVPYEHIEAPYVLTVDGVRAFNAGDPVPVDTARRLGLLDSEDAPPILPGTEAATGRFVDSELKVDVDPPAGGAGDASDTPDGSTPTDPTPPTGDASTTATPPQAPAVAPKSGRTAPTNP